MRRPGSPDDGSTLVEALVAVSIVSIAFTAIVGGMFTTVTASDVNRQQANAATYLASSAEAVKADPYVACAASYAGAGFVLPAGFSQDPPVVAYWNAGTSTFDASCGTDAGLQRVTLTIRSADDRVVVGMQLAKRAP